MADPIIDSSEQALEQHAQRAREVEHRVKNTLQLISSIVLLQGRRASDEAARQALKAVQQRVAAVSVAHRHVSWNDEAELVEVAALVREIVGDLAGSAGREDLDIGLDLDSLTIPGRQAAPVALLVNEMVGNALRHAYPGERTGRIEVTVRRTASGLDLVVRDNGIGMPAAAAKTGFGLTLVQLMTQQLRGRLETADAQPGLRLAVSVPMDTAPLRP